MLQQVWTKMFHLRQGKSTFLKGKTMSIKHFCLGPKAEVKIIQELTQSLWSCLQSRSAGIDPFSFSSSLSLCLSLSLCGGESVSLAETSADTQMSQVL